HIVYGGELAGAVLALDIIASVPRLTRATIFIDNTSAIRALPRRAARTGQHLVKLFNSRLASLRRQRRTLTIGVQWSPGHHNIWGNELADELAKAAAEGTTRDLPDSLQHLRALPRSVAAVRQQYR
ncbi:uncharacterized protein SCHCODRAFT_02456162, partial [Schizophyllum commune H4-8]|uniref:uncharacterized protein n=1 Tax=Schizophyllum commune (strain H4-8 / FGSC 9210) TaxID=578458 RepID=UPI00215F322A